MAFTLNDYLSREVTENALPEALKKLLLALAETVFTQHRLQHADDFGALFVHRHGVEIVDFAVAVGADGVRHGTRIFRKLGRAQCTDVTDAFDGTARGVRRHVHREFLISENCEAFL